MIQIHTDSLKEINNVLVDKKSEREMRIVKTSEICVEMAGNVPTSFYENADGAGKSRSSFLTPDFGKDKDYLAVMANTMSAKDYEEMIKEGHRIEDFDECESVNTLDKIKAKLAESGVVIKGYNDDLSVEEAEEILGSKAAAEALIKEFAERDLTLDTGSLKEAGKIFEKAAEIDGITDGMCDYILRNAIEPTIDNLYRVRFCAAEVPFKESGYFTDETGYKVKDAEGNPTESDSFVKRIEGFAKEMGVEDAETVQKEADWLVRSKIFCNRINLETLHKMKALTMPPSEEETAAAIANAYERGFDASKADWSKTENLSEKTKEVVRIIAEADSEDVKKIVENGKELTAENLKAVKNEEYRGDISEDNAEYIRKERVLTEIRFRMTFEAGYRLAKQGIAIEKAVLEEAVNVLKALEDKTSREFFGEADYEAKRNLYDESRKVIAEMPFIPAKAIGDVLKSQDAFTVKLTYETGIILKEQFEKAGKEYETFQTEIRKDLGDDIRKTFDSAYKILKEEGLPENDTFKKAVRILGYSETELTKENIENAAKAESSLSRVMNKMTPGAVLRLIRDGINPLETPMDRLEDVLDGYEDEAANSADNYARFLVRLEQRKEISAEERESFIGIYRLLDKIEKSDGSALGNLMSVDAQINFKNLLTAVRSGKSKGIDFKLDSSLGEIVKAAGYDFDIKEQIKTSFENFAKEEENDEFLRKEYETYKEIVSKDYASEKEELCAIGEKITPANLSAMSQILFDKKNSNPWKQYAKYASNIEDNGFSEALSKLSESFEDPKSVKEAYENVFKEAEDGMKKISGSDVEGYVDIKAVKAAFRQIGLLTRMTNDENYEVPVMTEDGMFNIRLKIMHKAEKEGKVLASFDDEVFGKILARFEVSDGVVSGLIAGESEVGLEKLKGDDSFEENFEKAGFEKVTFNYIHTDIINEDYFRLHFDGEKSDEVTTKELYRIAQTFIEIVMKAGR